MTWGIRDNDPLLSVKCSEIVLQGVPPCVQPSWRFARKELSRPVTPNRAAFKRWVVILVIGISFPRSNAQPAENALRAGNPSMICDLFANLESFSGRIVVVRGIYWKGLRQACRDPLVVRGRTYPTAIELVDSASVSTSNPVSFKTDDSSWNQVDKIVIREAKARHHEEIWVTVVGQLRAIRTQEGSVAGGYGHLGAYPAELVVERMFDVRIVSRPTYDYGEILKGPVR